MEEKIKNLIKETLKNLGIKEDVDFSVEHPENLDNGDYSSNVVLIYSKKINENPKKLAEKIFRELNKNKTKEISKIEIAGPGFINFFLTSSFFVKKVEEILEQKENFGKNNLLAGKKIMVEYTQPNPFKPFHIGHLMSNAIGESISRLVEFSGAKVVRANYQGDVGPHVAKAIYVLIEKGVPEKNKTISEQARYIGECYAEGSEAYENYESTKAEIDIVNKKVYDRSDKIVNEIYDWGRKVTLEAFEKIYETLGTRFDKYYFESEMAMIGKKIVEKNPKNIFEKSDGAIVFRAEKYDPKLHTRVFINSQGLPTYETKELGLTHTKFKSGLFSKKLDLSIVTTAVEQAEYMKVVQKAIEIMHPSVGKKMKHITHGMMRLAHRATAEGLASSIKMSSRKGNIISGEDLLEDVQEEVFPKILERDFTQEEKIAISKIVGVAALKYSILKQAIGGDIVFDFEKSISFEGNSGPYLQYSYARARSILEKAKRESSSLSSPNPASLARGFAPCSSDKSETMPARGSKPAPEDSLFAFEIERLLCRFPEVVLRSAQEYAPHHIANYLIELSQAFNTFYGNTKILDKADPTSPYKVALTEAFSIVLKNGLYLLGIQAPEKM